MDGVLGMGGYAAYVWPAYGITAVVMLGLLITSLREMRKNESQLAALKQAHPRRRARAEEGQS
ncbi:MAG: heme exporter protein CcmD [Alphaproteobacteria bacterium]|nr:heme exporter protein CcmD [Alphaproteobacteria bacterium]